MKRGISLALLVWVVLCLLSGCGGNVRNVERLYAPSSLYSQEEIDAAMDVAIRYFKKEFSGCTLTQIQYPGDDVEAFAHWADQCEKDQAIILTSSFTVDASGGDGSLNPNSTYTGWNWILVRDGAGRWEHADHGY